MWMSAGFSPSISLNLGQIWLMAHLTPPFCMSSWGPGWVLWISLKSKILGSINLIKIKNAHEPAGQCFCLFRWLECSTPVSSDHVTWAVDNLEFLILKVRRFTTICTVHCIELQLCTKSSNYPSNKLVIPCSGFPCFRFSSFLALSGVPSWLLSATPTRTHCLEEGVSPDWTDSEGGETVRKYPLP